MSELNKNNEEMIEVDEEKELSAILQIRRDKLQALKDANNDPFTKVKYDFDTYSVDIKNNFEE